MRRIKLPVRGMTCAHCSRTVEDVLQKSGVKASVNLAQATVTLTYDEASISLVYLQRLIKKAGYDLVLPQDKKHIPWPTIRLYIASVVLVLSLLGMLHHLGLHYSFFTFFDEPLFRMITASISLIALGLPFNIRAVKAVKNRALGMDFLVSLSTLIAFMLSLYTYIAQKPETYFETTTMILAIITIGDWITAALKKSTGASSQNALKNEGQLVELRKKSGEIKKVDIDELEAGDLVLVRKGERIGADGVIVEGSGLLDERILTGESRPRPAARDQMVYCGTVNLGDEFTMRVEKTALDSLYTAVILESYALDRSGGHLNKLSDTIASIFVPVVLLISALGFLINLYALHLTVEQSLINAVSILVVSCPCAFGLAVPLASLNGYNKALKLGIMFRSGSTFEKIKKVNEFYFDKTGTLTTGKMKVIAAHFESEEDKSLVAALEEHSLHPLAAGVTLYLNGVPSPAVADVKDYPGQGLEYQDYRLGSYEFVGAPEVGKDFIEADAQQGTKVYLTKSGRLKALLTLADELAPGAAEVIHELKKRGIHTYMLTGDNKKFALHIGRQLGLEAEEIYCGLLPSDKKDIIEKNRKPSSVTAYCGDGVNDLLALSLVDLGIASYKASSAASSRADVLLLKDDLRLLSTTIDLSRHVYYNIMQNFLWALGYNAIMIPLALIGDLSPTLSAGLMIISNITLILNSWRLKLWKGRRHEDKS